METLFDYISSLSLDSAHLALNMVWLGLALTVVVGLVWRFARPNEAGIRYAAWWSVLTIVIALPFLVNGTAGQIFNGEASVEEISSAPIEPHQRPAQAATGASIGQTSKPDRSRTMTDRPQEQTALRSKTTVEPNRTNRAQVMGSVETKSESELSVGSVLLGLLPMTLFLTWFGISGLLLMRLLSSHRRMVSIKRSSRPLDLSYWPQLAVLLKNETGERAVSIRCSAEIDLPVAAGLGHPVILMPDHLIDELTQPEFEAIVRHELAHIRRWDDWTKLAQKVLEAIAFFHPAVRWIGRQLDLEREMACDELVVQQTGDPTAYAQCLTRLAQLTNGSTTSLVPGALNGRKQIFKRIGSLLNRSGHHRKYSRIRITAFIVSVLAALFLMVQAAPVIAVPGRAVTLDELSQTVRALMPEAEAEAEAKPVVEEAQAETAEQSLGIAYIQFGAQPLMLASLDEQSEDTGESESKDRAETNRSDTEEKDTYVRVVNWSNKMFDMPISGVIHGEKGKPSTVVWTSDDRKSRVALQGKVRFDSENRAIRSIPKGGFVAIRWLDDDSETDWWELDITRGKGGKPSLQYYHNGRPIEEDNGIRKWKRWVLRQAIPTLRSLTGGGSHDHVPPVPPAPSSSSSSRSSSSSSSSSSSHSSSSSSSSSRSDRSVGYVYTPGDDGSVPQVVGLGSGDASGYVIADGDGETGGVEVTPLNFSDYGAYVYGVSDDSEPKVYAASGSKRRGDRGLVGQAWDWAGDAFDELSRGTSHIIDEDHHQIRWNDGRSRILVELDGEIEFTDDDRGIKSISRRGYIAILEKRGSKRREIEIEPNADGSLDYIYELNGRDHDFDTDAKEWLAEIILEIIRNSAVGATERVQRYYAEGGVDGVFEEMLDIESDYVRGIYFQELAAIDGLTEREYGQIITEAGDQMDSDYEKAEFLISLVDQLKENPALKMLFVDAVGTIDSDYEKRRILSELTFGEEADPELIMTVLAVADEIDSDYEKAELMIELAPVVTSDSVLLRSYVDAVESIDSDYETRRVLSELAFDDDVDEEVVLVVLRIARMMDSDYEKAELLIEMAPYSSQYALARDAYVSAIRNTDSDYETRRIISALSNKRDLDSEAVEDLLHMAEEMDSDYEKAELLIELSELCEDDAELLATMMQSAATLDSDYESRRVLSSLRLDCESQPDLTEGMLEIVEGLDSDYETAEVLLDLAECAAIHEKFRDSYLRAADNLDSDYERKRVLTELIDESDEPDSAMIVGVLVVIEDMESDFEKVELLTELAPYCRGNDFLEEAYTDVVETMDSDFEIDRAYSRLYRRHGRSGSDRSN
ncbi:MAG: hypothetical protein OEV49_12825 [candidate division Zixibacteria bacterium]|nr:hypothetical protein [candidate division Zixibacteria bacterium]MDH3936955.1 hypothetical protein [candidate division Zixibacteria bacterium]MDH4033452.1 hypothetical protein [candidate division Zixibacteria bacterium]